MLLTTTEIVDATPFHIAHTHSAQITSITVNRDFLEDRRLRPETIRGTILAFGKDNCQDHLHKSDSDHTRPTSPNKNLEFIWSKIGNSNKITSAFDFIRVFENFAWQKYLRFFQNCSAGFIVINTGVDCSYHYLAYENAKNAKNAKFLKTLLQFQKYPWIFKLHQNNFLAKIIFEKFPWFWEFQKSIFTLLNFYLQFQKYPWILKLHQNNFLAKIIFEKFPWFWEFQKSYRLFKNYFREKMVLAKFQFQLEFWNSKNHFHNNHSSL